MKKAIMILSTVMLCFGIWGCRETSEPVQAQDDGAENKTAEELAGAEPEKGEVDFLFQYQDVYEHILLEDCEVWYEKDGTTVYSKYMYGMPYSDYEDFPDGQYVLYVRTPYAKLQLFPVKDFRVCGDTDTVYLVREKEGFEALQRLDLKNGDGALRAENLEDYASMERRMIDVWGLAGGPDKEPDENKQLILDVRFEFAGNEGVFKEYTGRRTDHRADGLKGYASGIAKSTAQKLYMDYEWYEEGKEGAANPCALREYDAKKDSEAFQDCQEAYRRIMQGDWSGVALAGSARTESTDIGKAPAGMEYLWGMDGEDWIQADLNGDGMPELISQNGNGDRTGHKKPIDLIFTWNEKRAELVYVDLIDAMEFLFLGDKGQLIYEWSTSGGPKRSEFTRYHFDEKWKLAYEESLCLLYFLDKDDYEEDEREYYEDRYWGAFGTYGGGLYFEYFRMKTGNELMKSAYSYHIGEWITPNRFEAEYNRMTGREFLEDNSFYWEAEFEECLTGEKFFDYELRTGEQGEQYAVIKGIREEYRDDFVEKLERLINGGWKLTFPEQLDGVTVKEFDDYAFQNIPLGDCGKSLELSPDIVSIGEHCFENCGLWDVTFEKEDREKGDSKKERKNGTKTAGALTIGDGAFADNPELWGIYFHDREVVLGKDVFADCAKKVYLCYRKGTKERADYFKGYGNEDFAGGGWADESRGGNRESEKDAQESRTYGVEIPACYIETPLVDYPDTPYVLKPEIRNFFYGENGESVGEGMFCTLEYDDKAPDYGFPEWHAPCGEFCAMADGKYEIAASSELRDPSAAEGSGSDSYSYPGRRYEPGHLSSGYGREYAWAEGVEGNGIGESVSITSSCSYQYQKEWYEDGELSFTNDNSLDEFPPDQYAQDTPDIYDGYMRYTEICVVNGYAKDQKTWEENGRVKRLLMYVEDKPYAYLELADTIKPQYFDLPVDTIRAADGVDVHFRFVIEDVYPGIKYEDTCLTGLVVEFMGRRGH